MLENIKNIIRPVENIVGPIAQKHCSRPHTLTIRYRLVQAETQVTHCFVEDLLDPHKTGYVIQTLEIRDDFRAREDTATIERAIERWFIAVHNDEVESVTRNGISR